MHKKKCSHTEAIEEVYKHTPQIADYDKFMHIGARWLPYTMYFHEKNFRSEAVNTDSLGFRYTFFKGLKFSANELHDLTEVNLLVGGSTALGVGSTSDATTVASYLSAITDQVWLTFAGRGYNATQELLLYMMHQEKLPKIKRVLVFSGMNTLALEGMPNELTSDHGRYYYSYEFIHYMNKYNEDIKKQKNSFHSSNRRTFSLSRMMGFNKKKNPADHIIDDSKSQLEDRIDRAAQNIAKSLTQLKLLLSQDNTKIDFVLQPLSYWSEKKLTHDETLVFQAIDNCPNNFYRLFSGVLGKEAHLPYFHSICTKAKNIACYDMNSLLKKSPHFQKTLFVDRVHFNDLGNAEMAILIKEFIL